MPLHYEIKVKGVLDEDWSEWFDGLRITHDAAGNTMLAGPVRDQTALYGLIGKLRDLHLSLIAVEQRTLAMKADPAALPGYTGNVADNRCHSGQHTKNDETRPVDNETHG